MCLTLNDYLDTPAYIKPFTSFVYFIFQQLLIDNIQIDVNEISCFMAWQYIYIYIPSYVQAEDISKKPKHVAESVNS